MSVLDAAEVALVAHADAVVLVGQVQARVGLVVEGLYLSRDSGVVLQTAVLRWNMEWEEEVTVRVLVNIAVTEALSDLRRYRRRN